MVQETLRYIQDTEGVSLSKVATDDLFPIASKEDFESALVAKVRAALAVDSSLNRCSFSHITSIPALILPIVELSQACHDAGATVIVDGAHTLGQIPLDIPALGVDIYVSNGHKWLYTPKGSAFLWVTPALQGSSDPYTRGNNVYPVVISNEGQGESDYAKLFSYEGTKDYSNCFLRGNEGLLQLACLPRGPRLACELHAGRRGGDGLYPLPCGVRW